MSNLHSDAALHFTEVLVGLQDDWQHGPWEGLRGNKIIKDCRDVMGGGGGGGR